MRNIKTILVGLSGRPSIKALYPTLPSGTTVLEKTETRSGEIIRVHANQKNFLDYKPFKKGTFNLADSIVVRWGNRIPLNMTNCIVYNTAEASAKASNKKTARQILEQAKVPIPVLVTPKNFKSSYLPIIARPSYHSKCKNLRILKTKDEFLKHYAEKERKGWYYSQYIDKEHEYRIHCAHGKVLSISEKPRPKNHTAANPVYGWGYSVVEEEWRVIPWNEYRATWCKTALDAVKAMGLDFGAVDIVTKDKQAYVLEINTAGSLTESEYLRKRYSMYINWLFASKKRRDHWDYSKFEAGKSMAWKNDQLSLK